jgi:hypothetical protein
MPTFIEKAGNRVDASQLETMKVKLLKNEATWAERETVGVFAFNLSIDKSRAFAPVLGEIVESLRLLLPDEQAASVFRITLELLNDLEQAKTSNNTKALLQHLSNLKYAALDVSRGAKRLEALSQVTLMRGQFLRLLAKLDLPQTKPAASAVSALEPMLVLDPQTQHFVAALNGEL